MPEIRELAEGETHRAVLALLELRPHRGPAEALVAQADAQRAAGYRLVASFDEGEEDAAGVAGFRLAENLAWGRHLYVDDLVTRAERRGRGMGCVPIRSFQSTLFNATASDASGCEKSRPRDTSESFALT